MVIKDTVYKFFKRQSTLNKMFEFHTTKVYIFSGDGNKNYYKELT